MSRCVATTLAPQNTWRTSVYVTAIAATLSVLLFLLLAPTAQAQETAVVSIDDVLPHELQTDGFVLRSTQEIEIEAVGPTTRRNDRGMSNAWILDARTREVVWELERSSYNERRRYVREISETLMLPAGPYEVYYASFPSHIYVRGGDDRWDDVEGLGDVLRNVFDEVFDWDNWKNGWDWNERVRDEADEFGIRITAKDAYNERNLSRLSEAFSKGAFIAMNGLRDDRYLQQGFTLAQDMDVEVYALGEIQRGEEYDYGWILNAETGERVWAMNYRTTDHAGGAAKNRVANEILRMPAGKYAVFFVTDGSHSAESWNAAPPYDPVFWGLTLRTLRSADAQAVSLYDYEHAAVDNAIVSLRRMRDDAYETQGFTLKRPMDVRVYALGEGTGGDMYDYGWIIDADTRERVWTMEYRSTERAGGAEKNRVSDEVIRLDAGNYIVRYVTDGSHSYRDWNSSPPYDQEAWGITLIPTTDDFSENDVAAYDEADRVENAIVSLTRIRDGEYKSEGFTLKKSMTVRIYAVGEGTGDMHDYGWVTNARTGERVWEMDYRETEHAGGARKNRMAQETIRLEEGSYIVHYVSDGSHSYRDWNSSPPFDQDAWGIMVLPTDDFDAKAVTAYSEEEDTTILAQIVRVRDDAYKRATFTLDKDTEVRIYALGEGTGGDMYDYGWIKNNDTGRVVWEMTYRMTDHAGGARKNRSVNTVIVLPEGEYTLYYESDDSHAYNDWNSSPPHDPVNWGITVRNNE